MTDWNQNIDLYCERITTGLMAEPFNVYSNVAFLIAAFLVWRFGKKNQLMGGAETLLVVFMVLVAIGSTLFHMLANRWSMVADLAPILMFQTLFVFQYGKYIARHDHNPWIKALLMAVAYVGCVYLIGQAPIETYNGSVGYLPALIFLVFFAIYHSRKARKKSFAIWLSVIFFFCALAMRSVDLEVCEFQVSGTHYAWHAGAALSMYFAMIGLLATRMDGRHLRSKHIKGLYKGDKIDTLDPHDVVEFD